MRSHISPDPQSPTIGLYQCYDQYILGLAKHVDIPSRYTPGTLLISTLLGDAPSCDISIPTFSLIMASRQPGSVHASVPFWKTNAHTIGIRKTFVKRNIFF